jgi:hypothetical protein
MAIHVSANRHPEAHACGVHQIISSSMLEMPGKVLHLKLHTQAGSYRALLAIYYSTNQHTEVSASGNRFKIRSLKHLEAI